MLRIILSSTEVGDIVFDPFAGTGTTLVVAEQLKRKSIGIEIDKNNVEGLKDRLERMSQSDDIMKYYKEYIYTKNLKEIWGVDSAPFTIKKREELSLFKL